MPKCVICGGTDFYAEAGFYFCKECQTQNEDIREEVLELRVDLTTRMRKIRIRQDKSSISEQNLGWTTWEQYNFILIGMTNELIELGASMDIKLTILQLWSYYLGKIEVAFTSTTKKSVPRLARKFHKRDADIIYGKIAQRKKNRRRGTGSNTSASSMISGMQSEGSSNRDINKHKKRMIAAEYERFVQSQESSEGDALSVMNQSLFSVQSSAGKSSAQTEDNIQFNKAAKKEFDKVRVLSMKLPRSQRTKYRQKHTTSQYKIGPQLITPMKLWALIYLALRIHDENIHLADMLRYGREGHLSYYRLDHLLPPEVTLSRSETNLLHQTKEITHRGMRQSIGTMAKFLDVWETKNPDILSLIGRYCVELQLPKGITIYAERMMAMSPPKMPFDTKTASFPNYEGRAMAFLIVVMKILFGLDGITEYEISRVAEKINSAAATRGILDSRLFSFREWQRYIECRRCVIANVHFPTKFKREPDARGNSNLYMKFLAAMRAKCSDREEPEVTSYKHLLPRDLADSMKKTMERLNENANSVEKDVDIFRASLTPQYSYLQQLLADPLKDIPSNLRTDFNSMKIGYMTKPEALQALAAQCNIDLSVTDTGIHFIEKIMTTFEQSNLPTINEFNKSVSIEQPAVRKSHRGTMACESSEEIIEYLNRKNPGNLFVDTSKLDEYAVTRKPLRHRRRDMRIEWSDDFGFDEVTPSGKLAIPNEDDSDNESVRSVSISNGNEPYHNKNETNDPTTIDFLARYNVTLTNFERSGLVDSTSAKHQKFPVKGSKRRVARDPVTGKFISADLMINLEKTKTVASRTRKRRQVTLREIEKLAVARESNERNDRDNEDDDDDKFTTRDELDSSYNLGLCDDDISILHETSFNSLNGETRLNVSLDDETRLNGSSLPDSQHETEKLFRPYSEYWMYRCNFSRVKHKKFRQLENNLPASFRWLLDECASVIEMAEDDLYEEVCLVEAYYADILRPTDLPSSLNHYDEGGYRTKAHCNVIKKKW